MINLLCHSNNTQTAAAGILGLLLAVLSLSAIALAQSSPKFDSIDSLMSTVDKTLDMAPAPPEGDIDAVIETATELGLFDTPEGLEIDDSEGENGKEITEDSDREQDDPDILVESKPNQKIFSLGQGESDPEIEIPQSDDYHTSSPGSPGMYFRQFIQQISAQECMRRARAAFESQGMKIVGGDYWWYGASEPRFHGYNNCLDIGNGNTIVNFTSASWTADTLEHLNRVVNAYNATPGTLSQKPPITSGVPVNIPELYMWVKMINMSQSECMKRATNAIRSEGLDILGSDAKSTVSWIGAVDRRFNTYVTCTNLGSGNVYVNVTSASSQAEDITGHRDRIVKEFN